MTIPLLDIRELTVQFKTRRGDVTAINEVSLSVNKGETLGIVGESGSGKSVTSLATMRILDRAGHIVHGAIRYGGIDLVNADERSLLDLRGREISMIFQNPRAALNPIRKVGVQIADVLRQHSLATRGNARQKAIDMLQAVKIRDAEARYHAYPFQLSGGMCQRIVIAIALACKPQLLIADEPTTGLDVTTQKAVMDLIVELTRERNMATLLITHDLGLAATYCNRIVVMEKGQVIESNTATGLFSAPREPYTRKLLRATPRMDSQVRDLLPIGTPHRTTAPMPVDSNAAPVLEVKTLGKHFGHAGRRDFHEAVKGISFSIRRGESLGLVGESGCGKSTTSALIMRLLDPSRGSVLFEGQDITRIRSKDFARHPLRGKLQMVFQDPTDSLNPRWSAGQAIADPLRRLGKFTDEAALEARVQEISTLVELPKSLLDRFPHQLSGGQKARVGIARAIALEPSLLILDEPTAALDVSVQAVVLNLLEDLKHRLNMSYLFISHDLNVVRLLCDRILVMRAGEIVEQGYTQTLLNDPETDYTRTLLAAIPHPPAAVRESA